MKFSLEGIFLIENALVVCVSNYETGTEQNKIFQRKLFLLMKTNPMCQENALIMIMELFKTQRTSMLLLLQPLSVVALIIQEIFLRTKEHFCQFSY